MGWTTTAGLALGLPERMRPKPTWLCSRWVSWGSRYHNTSQPSLGSLRPVYASPASDSRTHQLRVTSIRTPEWRSLARGYLVKDNVAVAVAAHAHAFLFACASLLASALQRHLRLCVLRFFKHVHWCPARHVWEGGKDRRIVGMEGTQREMEGCSCFACADA